MVADALRGYLQLASGLTEVTRERAREAAAALAAQIDAVTGQAQVRTLADDLLATARANRDHIMALVKAEVDQGIEQALGNVAAALTPETVASLGLASAADVSELQMQVTELAARLAATEPVKSATTAAKKTAATQATGKQAAAKKTTAKKTTAKKAAAKKTTAKTTAAKKATATKATATKATARKSAGAR